LPPWRSNPRWGVGTQSQARARPAEAAAAAAPAAADETDTLMQRLMPEVCRLRGHRCGRSAGDGSRSHCAPALQVTRLSRAATDGGRLFVTFGTLARDPQCERMFDALGGALKSAKKRGLVSYDGELLLEGKHDDVEITVLRPSGTPAAAPRPAPKPAVAPKPAAPTAEPPSPPGPAVVIPPAAATSTATTTMPAVAATAGPASVAVQTVGRIFNGDPSIDWCVRSACEGVGRYSCGRVVLAYAGPCSNMHQTCRWWRQARAHRTTLWMSSARATCSLATSARPWGASVG
jgi:hypothetical protein